MREIEKGGKGSEGVERKGNWEMILRRLIQKIKIMTK